MNKPFVSVVIPVYNSQETIKSCLDSLINLDYPLDRYEIILVNDHSTDKSASIMSAFEKSYANISLINQVEGKKGPAAARNLGIMHAKGEFIASTDSDEFMFSDWLNLSMPYFLKENVAAVGSLLIEQHPLDEGLSTKIQSILIDNAKKPSIVSAGSTIYRKKALQKVGYFNEFCVFNDLDVDMHYRLLDKGYILKPIKNLAGQHKQRHNLQAFYRRMKGFGAAGLIISLLNFKNAFSSSYKNKKGVLEYNILALFIASFVLLTAIAAYFSIKTAFLIMISTFLVVFLISSIIAIARIGSAKANMFYFPGVLVYVMVKWLAILHGVFFGAFYYFNNNSKLGALNENS